MTTCTTRDGIGPGEVHVWTVATDVLESSGQLTAYAGICSAEEQDRSRRFFFEQDRRSFVAAHGLVRLALSWCEPAVEPEAWRFQPGPHGRPETAGPAPGLGLRTNISHTPYWVACVVTRGLECGIDIEGVRRDNDHRTLVARTLTADEAREVWAAAPSLRPRRFIERWTLKEALAKALGLGLSLPFDQVGFAILPTGIRLADRGPAGPAGDGDRWFFGQWEAGDHHVVGLAVRTDGVPLRIVHHGAPDPSSPRVTFAKAGPRSEPATSA